MVEEVLQLFFKKRSPDDCFRLVKKYKPKQNQMGLMYRIEWLIVGWHGVVYSGWDDVRCEATTTTMTSYSLSFFWNFGKYTVERTVFLQCNLSHPTSLRYFG